MAQSWMVGDRDTDIQCGKAAGVRTIRVAMTADAVADFTVTDLAAGAGLIVRARD